jgi:glycosyltransferase involved in cell wall biosynthesis
LKQRLRVLAVIDGFSFGGEENRVLQLAQAIDRERFDFRVATIRPNDPGIDRALGNLRAEYERSGVPVIDLSVPRMTRGLPLNDMRRHVIRIGMLAATVGRIAAYARREQIDVLSGHLGAGYLCSTFAAALLRRPNLITTYNLEQWKPRIIWSAMHRGTLRLAGAVITDSHPVADDLRSWMLPARRARVHVIPNGPPPPVASTSHADVRARLGLPPHAGSVVVGHIAGHTPGKGQHVLIDAAPAVLARFPHTTFLLVGFERRAGYSEELRARARRLGVDSNVIVTSYQGPIGDVWQTVDIQAHPTMQDSLPNAILEGMALGKPLVASAHAGIPSMVLHDFTGIVVAPGDVDALAGGLIRLLDNPEDAREFGAAARRRYYAQYTPDHLARRMEAVFTGLAQTRRRG